MGSSSSTSLEKARKLEEKLLIETGLELNKDLHIADVPINYLGENFIHTISCGENQNILVMLHGYGGSNVFYYKMLKDLSKSFKVYCIDLLGMGLSSHPGFECSSTEETIKYFIDSLEEWRATLGLGRFILCGHSFGGYMAAQYAKAYPKYVRGLMLLSPLGFYNKRLEEYETKNYKNISFMGKWLYNRRDNFFKKKKSMSDVTNSWIVWMFSPIAKKKFIERYNLPSELGEVFWCYLMEIFKLPNSSDKAIHYIIDNKFAPFYPLEELMEKIDLPVTILYGDYDWMDSQGAEDIDNMNKKNFKLYFVKDCGHQMIVENPTEVTKQIENKLKFLKSIRR